jgi:hypothetical protein
MREKAVDAIKQYENVILSTNIAFNEECKTIIHTIELCLSYYRI